MSPFFCLIGAVAVVTDVGNQDPSSANSRPVSLLHKFLLAHTGLLRNEGSFPPLCFGPSYTPLQVSLPFVLACTSESCSSSGAKFISSSPNRPSPNAIFLFPALTMYLYSTQVQAF